MGDRGGVRGSGCVGAGGAVKASGSGPWLTDRKDDGDAMVWAKVDRAFRSAKGCADVAHWTEENGKVLVFADDGITLDYREGRGEFVRERVGEGVLDVGVDLRGDGVEADQGAGGGAHKHLRKTDRWAGGQPPYGYRIVDRAGEGRTLEPDPVTSEAVRYMGRLRGSLVSTGDPCATAGCTSTTGASRRRARRRARGSRSRWVGVHYAGGTRTGAPRRSGVVGKLDLGGS